MPSNISIKVPWGKPQLNRRHHLLIVSTVLVVSLFLIWSSSFIRRSDRNVSLVTESQNTSPDSDVPPYWDKLKDWEYKLPQHDLDLPKPEGKNGRYVLFKNQIQMLGWNNVLNELLMNSYLAYKSKRAYVWQDYIWKWDYYPWPESLFRQNPPHTPLNALIAGPTVGGPWDAGDDAPRSISEAWFDVVCPKEERRIINTRDVKPAVQWSEGNVIFDHWNKLLLDAPERCIEIQPAPREEDGYGQTFDLWLWGTTRILSLWEDFKNSPVSRLLATSPVVNAAVDRNEYLFLPKGPRPSVPVTRNPYDRMLAIHLRRGDYKQACQGLADWNSTFYSWNLLDFLPDKFEAGPGGGWGWNTKENEALYFEHCLPTFDFIVKKIRDSRSDYLKAYPTAVDRKTGKSTTRVLDVLYLLTNDKSTWLDELKEALRKEGWHTIATTHDLQLTQEEKEVGMAVDMDIARRAAVFIGNGWSSFTSNIVHRRLVDGKEAISVRFY